MDKLFFNTTQYTDVQAKQLNPQALAFVGDGVYTLYIRTCTLNNADCKSAGLHVAANEYVNAKGQSTVLEKILPHLTEEETDVYKRGRNYKTSCSAKSSSIVEYKRATGFESLIGFLYLTNRTERLNEILHMCVKGE